MLEPATDRRLQLLATRPLGSPLTWARDVALVGFFSGLTAPLGLIVVSRLFEPVFVISALCTGLAGGVSGALLGDAMARLVRSPLGQRIPIALLLFAGLGVGAAWGTVAASSGLWFAPGVASTWILAIGAVAGALQFGWFWYCYLLRRIHARSTWPLLVGTAVSAPVLGWIALDAVERLGLGF